MLALKFMISFFLLLIFSGCNNLKFKGETNSISSISERELDLNTTRCYSEENAKALFAKCASCHGRSGDKEALGYSDTIAGEDIMSITIKLKEYKAGKRNIYGLGAVMRGQTKNLTDDDIRDLAFYIEKL